MPWPLLSFSKQIWIRSFKWGAVLVGQEAAKISEVEKNLPDQPGPECIGFETGRVGNFLPTSNFDLWYFCSLFTYKSEQYLIWKIWLISVWSLKPKAEVWLLTGFIWGQNTLSSYHTEANGCIFSAAGVLLIKMLNLNNVHLWQERYTHLPLYDMK